MIEHALRLDSIFGCLADATRRDILKRVANEELSVTEVAKPYKKLTFAAISKHLKVLENAKLVVKRRQGKHQFVRLAPAKLKEASEYLEYYKTMWEDRLDALEEYLKLIAKK